LDRLEDRLVPSAFWQGYARDPQHTALAAAASQPLETIHWQTPVDLNPQYSGSDLLIHYGEPAITANNTVIVPVKTGARGGFEVEGLNGTKGAPLWTYATDYLLPPYSGWTPSYSPTLTASGRLYFAGAGGTVFFMDNPDAPGAPVSGQFAFYGIGNYLANPAAYKSTVFINTPITADSAGNIYFGFQVFGANPSNLVGGIARIAPNGAGSWIPAATAAGNAAITKVADNSAPALSNDGQTLYVAVNNGNGDATLGYLVAVNSNTLAPAASILLRDPATGAPAFISDDGTASPTVGPDGDVYIGVLENPLGANHERGWLLHFSGNMAQQKITGAFGWDDTVSIVPASMVPSYGGPSSYLLMTKYNNYIGGGGDGGNRIAILDPNTIGRAADSGYPNLPVMNEVLTVLGPTPATAGGVSEWCINSAVVDPATDSILAGSEDGKLYRWNLSINAFTADVTLTAGLGEAYTPTLIGPDGTVYAINNATLFAVGSAAITRYVVPAGVPTDNLTTFASLQAALTAPGLSPGTIIQIEPGSAPGNVATFGPGVPNLTIQGDPDAALASVPQFTISTAFTVTGVEQGFTLKHANVALVAGTFSSGRLILDAGATITGSVITATSAVSGAPLVLASTGDVLSNTTMIDAAPGAAALVEVSTPGSGSSHLISGNIFVAAANVSLLVDYAGGSAAGVTDQVIDNTFIDDPGIAVGACLAVMESVSGLTIQQNTFTGPATTGIVLASSAPTNLRIEGNVFNLTQGPSSGIEILGGTVPGTLSALIAGNQVDTHGGGTAIYLRPGLTPTLNLAIQGNDLHTNQFGVYIAGPAGTLTGIDLGGGSQGSLGDNDFRSFTTADSPATAAIALAGISASQGMVQAQENMFALGIAPISVVGDPQGNLNLANALSPSAAYVASLYNRFLERPGDTNSGNDAGYWVTALVTGSLSRAVVAYDIVHSAEALGIVVNGLYETLLGRAADAGGQANFVAHLQNGSTVEQVVSMLTASPEYAVLVGADYAGSLYSKLLGRAGGSAEVAYWQSQVPILGRSGVAGGFLASPEFRVDVVEQFYGFTFIPPLSVAGVLPPLLYRQAPPSPAEVSGWAFGNLDVLTIMTLFTQGDEFFIAG
jgi:hypothetical protein